MKVAIVGMGISGQGAARLASAQGHDVTLLDSNPSAQKTMDAQAFFGIDWPSPTHFDRIILSPGVPPHLNWIKKAKEADVEVDGELSIAAQQINIPILAITGTNGKSSTAHYTQQLLQSAGKKAFLGGNFGIPLSDLVLLQDEFDVAVVEVSSYQLEGAQYFKPTACALLNLTPDHLARHLNMETYAACKRRIFEHCTTEDVVITNTDERLFPSPNHRHWILGQDLGATLTKEHLTLKSEIEQRQMNCTDVPLIGAHNYWNVAAAALLCHAIGIPLADCDVTRLHPLEHRLEPIRNLNGVQWVNDSKATNVEATEAALNGVSGPQIVLLGGAGKNGADYAQLLPLLTEKARHVICFGQSGQEIVNGIAAHPNCHLVQTLDAAMQLAHRLSSRTDTVLLSPACASFDAFNNFEHRGQTFRDFVLQLEAS